MKSIESVRLVNKRSANQKGYHKASITIARIQKQYNKNRHQNNEKY